MERNRDLRRATVSSANGLPKRRQRISILRDSTDEDRPMECQETVRLRDRERLQKKDRDRELPKRRRVDRSAVQRRSGGGESYRENESTDSSNDEYYEEDETRIHQQNRLNQVSPTSSSLSNNRRGLRTLRSSPALRGPADEMLSFPVPRRARSASTKRLHEYWNSGSGGFGEDLDYRRFSPSPATMNLTGSGGASSSSSGASMKKKMKSVEPRTWVSSNSSNSKPSSLVQDDIDEIEVAEALFDLMKQSQSQSQSYQDQERVDRDSTNTADDELKRLKAEGGKDENNSFSIQNEQSIKVNAETIAVDSVKELKQEGRIEKEKFPDDPVQKLVSGDGFVNKEKVGSRKESESPSCVKVNACDIQDPTVTKADYAAILVEATKEARLEIDLMAPPPLPSSPERDDLVDMATGPKVLSQSETISKDESLAVEIQMQGEKIGGISSNPLPNLDLEKRSHDRSSVSDSTSQQKQVPMEQKNQSPTSLMPFPIGIGMSGWPGVLPHPGYMPPLQAVLPIDGNARSSMIMLPPPFKFSESRPKRCATHQYIAHSIHYHQQLINKSLSSGQTGPATIYGTKSLNLNSMLPTQKFIPGNPSIGEYQAAQSLPTISSGSGKDKNSDISAPLNATASCKSAPQATYRAPANNLLHGPGFIFPLSHHQTTMMAPANSSGPPLSASAGRPSVNLPLPGGSAAVSFNHPMFSSHEAAAYMALLQNNGCPIPISPNIPMPTFKGPPPVPFFNSSFFPSPVFNVTQNQQQLSLPLAPAQTASQNTSTFSGSSANKQPQGQQQTTTKISDNKFPAPVTVHLPQPDKLPQPSHSSSKPDTEISRKSGTSVDDGLVSHSVKPNNVQTSSFSVQAVNFAMIPPMSINGGAVGNKHGELPQQGSKGRVELIPQAFALSFGSNASTALNFSSMAQNSAVFQMLPGRVQNGNFQQKNFQTSEGKFPIGSFNFSKSGSTDASTLSSMGTSKFDSLARTINFLPSTSALTSGVSATLPNFQQQSTQLQKLHMHQMQLTATPQVKPSTPNNIPGSFLSCSFPSKSTQVTAQTDNPSFPHKWENPPRTTAPEGSSQSANSTLINIPQLQTSQGQTHMTFGNSSVPAALSQGHQNITKKQPASPIMVGSSTIGSQETEASPNGPGQKSPPACRRTVPPILSTCPSQLSELKY